MNQGNLPEPYLNSVLDAYEFVLQKSPNYSDNTASKVKQEILHGLGNHLFNLDFWLGSTNIYV
jgi:hypothetical protein